MGFGRDLYPVCSHGYGSFAAELGELGQQTPACSWPLLCLKGAEYAHPGHLDPHRVWGKPEVSRSSSRLRLVNAPQTQRERLVTDQLHYGRGLFQEAHNGSAWVALTFGRVNF